MRALLPIGQPALYTGPCESQICGRYSTLDTTPPPQGPIAQLSEEVLLMIFKNLKRREIVLCAQVCRHWRYLAYDPVFWRKIAYKNRRFSADHLMQMLIREPLQLLLPHCSLGPLDEPLP